MEPAWTTRETDDRLMIIHDNRWLAIVGIPLILVGLLIAVGPWLIEDARNSPAWPILVVGSLLGLGFVVAGLSLCFNYQEIEADRSASTVFQRVGLPPFRRIRSWSWDEISEVAVVVETQVRSSLPGSSVNYRLRLIGPKCSLPVVSSLEREPVEEAAPPWARFLGKPLRGILADDAQAEIRRRIESATSKTSATVARE